jgi:hypothetical protein
MKDKKQFILDTLLPYKEDPTTCATYVNERGVTRCSYLTDDGRKCAVGRWMKNGDWQNNRQPIYPMVVYGDYKLKDILMDEAVKIGLSVDEWVMIQKYHDAIAMGNSNINGVVENLEGITSLELSELTI